MEIAHGKYPKEGIMSLFNERQNDLSTYASCKLQFGFALYMFGTHYLRLSTKGKLKQNGGRQLGIIHDSLPRTFMAIGSCVIGQLCKFQVRFQDIV